MVGQEPGRAVLFVYTAEGRVFADAFDEEPGQADPQLRAERLRDSIEDDFPGAIVSIGLNQRATDMMANRRMREMGIEDYDHATVQPGGR